MTCDWAMRDAPLDGYDRGDVGDVAWACNGSGMPSTFRIFAGTIRLIKPVSGWHERRTSVQAKARCVVPREVGQGDGGGAGRQEADMGKLHPMSP